MRCPPVSSWIADWRLSWDSGAFKVDIFDENEFIVWTGGISGRRVHVGAVKNKNENTSAASPMIVILFS